MLTKSANRWVTWFFPFAFSAENHRLGLGYGVFPRLCRQALLSPKGLRSPKGAISNTACLVLCLPLLEKLNITETCDLYISQDSGNTGSCICCPPGGMDGFPIKELAGHVNYSHV